MAIAPKTKEAPKAKTAAPKPKAKEAKEAKAPKEGRGPTRNGMVVDLLLERKWTDEEIKAKVNKAFAPLEVNNSAIPVARANLNKALSAKEQIERLFEHEGKRVPKSQLPAKPKKEKRAKVDPAKDPLKNVAGIDVHKNGKAATPKAAKAKAAVPA